MPSRESKTPVVLPDFTDNLNRLIGTYRWTDDAGRPQRYTTASLAQRLRDLGYDYSDSYVHQMRVGTRANPAAVLLIGLSQAFGGIDVRFWYPTEYPTEHADVLRSIDAESERIMGHSSRD